MDWATYFRDNDFIMIDEHVCEKNKISYIFYCANALSTGSYWYLFRMGLAEVEDVEYGAAEKIGDEICASFFLVNFCPFCGKKLAMNKFLEKSAI